jgi:hypothetical protein
MMTMDEKNREMKQHVEMMITPLDCHAKETISKMRKN